MNSEFCQKKLEFYNTRIVRSEFQFNNRNNIFRRHNVWRNSSLGHDFRGVTKPKKKWFQKRGVPYAQSQAAASSFATGSQCRPFTLKLPFNPTIAIPNFSGVRSQSVFRFQNSSTKSVKFISAPGDRIPQSSSFTENKGIGDTPLKSNETRINEDVEYLYTVQAKTGEVVEVIDISEDTDVPSCSNESRSSARSNISERDDGRTIFKIPEKETTPIPVKQDTARGARQKRKKSSEDLHCDICESEYEFIRSRGEEIFRTRCGHMFCELCLKGLNPYKCPECNIFLHKLLKVFF